MPSPTAASRVMPIDWSTRPISSMATQSAGEVAATAAVLFRRGEPEQPELTHRWNDLDRKMMLLIPTGGMRGDLGLGELADDLSERLMVGRQLEAHPPPSSQAFGAPGMTTFTTPAGYVQAYKPGDVPTRLVMDDRQLDVYVKVSQVGGVAQPAPEGDNHP